MFGIISDSLKRSTVPKRLSESEAIQLIESSDPWITSDYHIYKEFRYDNGHYAKELYRNAKIRTEKMLKMHETCVGKDDVVLFLGDLSESEINDTPDYQEKLKLTVRNMKGIKILIKGNNDEMPDSFYYDCGFRYVHPYMDPILSQKYKVVFSHVPWDICNSKLDSDWINIHGHIHGSKNYWNMDWHRHIDVFPEINDCKPMKIAELMKRYAEGRYKGKTTYHQQL